MGKTHDPQPVVSSPAKEIPLICKYCESGNVRKFGKYKDTQLYYCNLCKRKFTPNASLFHMKTPANQVSSALDMYYKGLSITEIREHLQQEYENTPSASTVFQWIEKYTDEAVKESDKYHPIVGSTWIADETYVRVDKRKVGDAKVENPYTKNTRAKWVIFWDIIDAETRFLLASRITTTRGTKDAQALMEKAAKVAGKTPRVMVTDKLAAYLDGVELAYGSDSEHKRGSPFKIENNTNLIERLHGTIKERTKVMRGLRTAETAKRFLDGWTVYYNYMKPHESLDSKTPAEAAKVTYMFRDWADIARMAKPQVRVLVTPTKVSILSDTPTVKFRPATRKLRTKRTLKTGMRASRINRREKDETTLGRIGK
ncbi:MAG: DDE-type integrase/transposase/recombinase [Chloroflexota bacterium]